MSSIERMRCNECGVTFDPVTLPAIPRYHTTPVNALCMACYVQTGQAEKDRMEDEDDTCEACNVGEGCNSDNINKPNHYNQGGIEVIDVIDAYDLNFNLGSVIKYVLRHKNKGKPLEDLKKARKCLDFQIKQLEDK